MANTLFRQYGTYLSSAILLSALAIAGCSDNDNPADPPGSSSTAGPKVGSTYDYHTTTTFSNGMVTDVDIHHTVAATGVAYAGKSNAVKIMSEMLPNHEPGQPSYYIYEPNGDMTAFFPINMNNVILDSTWVTYTFGSKGSMIYPEWDRVAAGVRTIVRGEGKYVGTEQLTVGSETFETVKMITSTDMSMGIPGMDPQLNLVQRDTLWYAPRIFNFVKTSSTATSTSGGMTTVIRPSTTLTGYKLQ